MAVGSDGDTKTFAANESVANILANRSFENGPMAHDSIYTLAALATTKGVRLDISVEGRQVATNRLCSAAGTATKQPTFRDDTITSFAVLAGEHVIIRAYETLAGVPVFDWILQVDAA